MHEVEHELLTKKLDELRLYPLGDLHIGHRGFQRSLFRDQVREIAADPAGLVVLTGDLIENVTRSSVGDLFEELEIVSPQDQADDAIGELSLIKDRIIGAVRGNHCYRTPKDMGIDPMAYICRGLEIPYFRDAVLLCLRFGVARVGPARNGKPMLYTVYASHLSGGAGTDGGKVNAASKMANVVVADVCIGGHTHAPETHKRAVFVPNLQNRQVIKREIQIVNAGTYQDNSGFGIRKVFAPVVLGSPVVTLSGRRRRTRCTV